MRHKTKQKVANLLSAVATTLEWHGRPRMLPGHSRHEATTVCGSRVRPTHPNAAKWSLLGAIKADAKALGYGASVRNYAMWAILDAENDTYNGGGEGDAVRLDEDTYDTRRIVRRVKKAQRQLERELVTA